MSDVDTENKRRSVFCVLPIADSTIDSADRRHATGNYRMQWSYDSRILVASEAETTPPSETTVQTMNVIAGWGDPDIGTSIMLKAHEMEAPD